METEGFEAFRLDVVKTATIQFRKIFCEFDPAFKKCHSDNLQDFVQDVCGEAEDMLKQAYDRYVTGKESYDESVETITTIILYFCCEICHIKNDNFTKINVYVVRTKDTCG